MEWFWVLLLTTILVFCLWVFYRVSFIKGYKAGARHVIREWRKTLNEEEQENGKTIRPLKQR